MAIPEGWSTVEVFSLGYVDSNGVPKQGRVHFKPRAPRLLVSDRVVISEIKTVTLDANGAFTVKLPVTNDPGVAPENFSYEVREDFPGGRKYDISVPITGSALNIANLAPVAPNSGSISLPLTRLEYESVLGMVGKAKGIAPLGSNGLVPSEFLPVSPKYFYPEEYGALGDGIADDTAAIIAAKTAAKAVGGVVIIANKYRITGEIHFDGSVSLRGYNSSLTDLTTSVIVLDSATAQVRFSGRGGYSGQFIINGNNSGNPEGALKYTAVQQILQAVTITKAVGRGLYVYAAQNCIIESVDVNESGTDNVVIDGGTGGMLFSRCEWTSATGYGLRITETAPGGHPTFGYQYGPADIDFHKCIIENYLSGGTGLALIEAGSRLRFTMCGFSINVVTITGNYCVSITNDPFNATTFTQVEFNSCNFNGGIGEGQKYPIFYVKGTNTITSNRLITSGAMFFQQTNAIYVTDGPTEGRINADEMTLGVTARFSALGSGSFSNWRMNRAMGFKFSMEDPTGIHADAHPIILARTLDNNGVRWWADRDGTLNWGNGGGFTSLASIGRNTSNNTMNLLNQTLNGKTLYSETDIIIPSTSYALDVDVATGGPVYGVTLTGATSIASWVLSNPLNLQQITLSIFRSGSQTVTWPTNVRFANNTAPALTGNTRTYITFQYISASGLWYETTRSADVPNS